MEFKITNNIYAESWSRLLEYANKEYTYELMTKNSSGKNNPNKIKIRHIKTEQIRSCLLQAKEYFDAAQRSSLYTQSNHIYYGAASLMSAIMLFHGNGTKRLDELGNKGHGLTFTLDKSEEYNKEFNLINSSQVQINTSGHFKYWYEELQKRQHNLSIQQSIEKSGKGERVSEGPAFDLPLFKGLAGSKLSLIELMKKVPDLYHTLYRFGVDNNVAEGVHIMKSDNIKNEHQHIFHFNSIYCKKKSDILSVFKCDGDSNYFYFNTDLGPGASVFSDKKKGFLPCLIPMSRMTLDQKFIFSDDDSNLPEIVDLYLIAYILSMLSRYYPHIWVPFIDSHCKGLKLIENLVSVLILKLPILALSQLDQETTVFSTFPPTREGFD